MLCCTCSFLGSSHEGGGVLIKATPCKLCAGFQRKISKGELGRRC